MTGGLPSRARGRLTPLPPAGRGQRIGLFGGSFDPPHAGHAHVVHAALSRLKLDRIWVLVTPGNPLKGGPSLELRERMRALERLIAHPTATLTALEADAGLRWSRDTVRYLLKRRPDLRFVWIMGADNLAGFHRWGGWRGIAESVPIAIVDRPGARFAPMNARAAIALARHRLPERAGPRLAGAATPAWVFVHARLRPESSTALRTAR